MKEKEIPREGERERERERDRAKRKEKSEGKGPISYCPNLFFRNAATFNQRKKRDHDKL
jgi:hypothetical protein